MYHSARLSWRWKLILISNNLPFRDAVLLIKEWRYYLFAMICLSGNSFNLISCNITRQKKESVLMLMFYLWAQYLLLNRSYDETCFKGIFVSHSFCTHMEAIITQGSLPSTQNSASFSTFFKKLLLLSFSCSI